MCNCGRKKTDVITSAQAQEDAAARAAQTAAANAEQTQQSANNAVANASSGWFTATE